MSEGVGEIERRERVAANVCSTKMNRERRKEETGTLEVMSDRESCGGNWSTGSLTSSHLSPLFPYSSPAHIHTHIGCVCVMIETQVCESQWVSFCQLLGLKRITKAPSSLVPDT